MGRWWYTAGSMSSQAVHEAVSGRALYPARPSVPRSASRCRSEYAERHIASDSWTVGGDGLWAGSSAGLGGCEKRGGGTRRCRSFVRLKGGEEGSRDAGLRWMKDESGGYGYGLCCLRLGCPPSLGRR